METWGQGFAASQSGGWLVRVEGADQQLIHLPSPLKVLHLSNSIGVLGFAGSG